MLTILRGQESSTAQAWAIGDLCGNVPTAGMLNQFVQPWMGIDTGAVNAYVVSIPAGPYSYWNGQTGQPITFWTLNANTATNPTLAVNGGSALWIRNADGTAILPGQIPANTPISVMLCAQDTTYRLVSPLGMPTNLTGSRALGTDSSGKITPAATTFSQLNMLQNWMNAFQNANSSPGYIVTPVGLTIQYGNVNITGESTSIFFAQPFANACVSIAVSEGAASGTWTSQPTIHAAQLSDVNGYYGYAYYWNNTLKNWVAPTPSSAINQCYIAIGY